MNQLLLYRLKSFATSALWGAGVSLSFMSVNAGALLPVFVPFALFSGIVATSVIFLTEFVLLPPLKERPVVLSMVVRPIGYFVAMTLAIGLTIWFAIASGQGRSPLHPGVVDAARQVFATPGVRLAVIGSFAGTLVLSFLFSVSRKLGPGVMRNWLLGRYHRPREEERVFMFLDMKDSTTLAESLGDLQFSALVRDFFVDITPALLSTRGEVSHYIGDEAVISWPLHLGLKDGACLRCFELVSREIDARASEYLRRYNHIPSFKAGLHLGQVVATEVGTIKSEIVFHGDVLNTTARITALCGELERDLLLSGELAEAMGPLPGWELERVGAFRLKGKAADVDIVAASPTGTPVRGRPLRVRSKA